MSRPVYLDCNATTPMEPSVAQLVMKFMVEEFGNSGSRTHEFGAAAKRAVQRAREQVAAVVAAKPDEVLFTSGATESNNLAILGLREHGEKTGSRHIITSAIEHKAVLEPIGHLEKLGFEVDYLEPGESGWVRPEQIAAALRPTTVLVSVMHVNNETGIIQPLSAIAAALDGHQTFFHVDAAQGFGKLVDDLRNPRIDLISVSGHKIYGPKGVGALVARRRGFSKLPLAPVMFGGGQERGLRPGTIPVALVAGLGLAAEVALSDHVERNNTNVRFGERLLRELQPLGVVLNGDSERRLPNVVNLSLPGTDSEAVMVALKDLVAFSNGSACTSQSYEPSHVLKAMNLSDDRARAAVRISWCHMTQTPDWEGVRNRLQTLCA